MKMNGESTHLSFAGFQNHISKMLDDNFIYSHFTDVTLVSDDNKHLSAHKIVLAASSPLLCEILLANQHQEPVLYFPSVKHEDLKSMLAYMYQGSVNIAQDRVEDFISFASQLEVKGLPVSIQEGNTIEGTYHKENLSEILVSIEDNYEAVPHEETPLTILIQHDMKKEVDNENDYNCQNRWTLCQKIFADKHELIEHRKLHTGEEPFSCEKCSENYPVISSLKHHIQIKHGDMRVDSSSYTFKCEYCQKKLLDKVKLNAHRRIHRGEKNLYCGLCDNKYKEKLSLRLHIRQTHEPSRQFLGNRAFLKCLVCFLLLLCTPVTAVCLTTAVRL